MEDMKKITEFAFSLGVLMGSLSNEDLRNYFMSKGVSLLDIAELQKTMATFAMVFYKEGKGT